MVYGACVCESSWTDLLMSRIVDQPAGTGFSYTSTDHYVHSLPQASEQLVQFLRTWYKVFPEYMAMDVRLS